MVKKICLILLTFLCYHSNVAQENTPLEKAIGLIDSNYDSAYENLQIAVSTATETAEKLTIYEAFCKELWRGSRLEELLNVCNEALKLPCDENSITVYANIARHKFQVFQRQKEYDSAFAMLEFLDGLAETYQDTLIAVKVMRERAAFLKDNGDITGSLSLLLDALKLAESSKNDREIAEVYRDIAIVYDRVNKNELAISYNLRALTISKKYQDMQAIARSYNNIGLIYDELNLYDSAEYYYQLCYDISDSLGIEFGKAISKMNIGLAAYRKKEYQRSIKLYNEVFPFFRGISDDYGIVLCYLNLTRNYNDIGQNQKALELGEAGFELAKKNGFINEVRALADELTELYEKQGDFKKSLDFKKEEMIAQDSIFNQDKDYEVGRLESKIDLDRARYENELKDQQNKILLDEATAREEQIKTQYILIVGAVLIAILLLFIAFILRKQLAERKKLLQKIEGQSAKLKELDQAKTRFFANVSHDLRSPLTLILGSLDNIMERDYSILDKESKESLDMGIKNGKRLLYLADEIMDLTRLEEGKIKLELQYVKIVPYLRLLTKMFSSAADIKSIELKFSSHAEDETSLRIDPHQFEKIIYNLLSNAIKFTPPQGVIDVQLNTDDKHIEIIISDSGPGIPPESLELVFDRYYQSASENTSQAGVGIGLALVKELVELHNGTIVVANGNEGAIFTIQFPFKKSDWVSKAIIPERSLDVVTRNSLWMDLQEEKERLQVPGIKTLSQDAKAILIVEDHKELRIYLQSILSTSFRVFMAANGTSALDILQTEKINLIITDLMMPYMDGFELVEHLKKDKELKRIPVVVVSARTDKKEKLDLISKGAEDVISKPFDKEELMVKIQNITSRDWDSNKMLSKLYEETAGEIEKSVMHKLEKLIIKRVDDPHLSVLDLADEMAASERKVYRMIKKISGLTPYELIKEVRWQYLENYLKENKVRTATEAAQVIGMNNVSSFANQFEKRFNKPFKDVLDVG